MNKIDNEKKILTDFLSEIFADKVDYAIELLEELQLTKVICTAIIGIKQKKYENSFAVNTMTTSLFTQINIKLGTIESQEEKTNAEYLIKKIAIRLILQVIKESKLPKETITEQISKSLKASCDIYSWDYDRLKNILDLELISGLSTGNSVKLVTDKRLIIKKAEIHYYQWLGQDLDILAIDLKDSKCIKSTKDFKKLFDNHDGQLKVKFNAKKLEFIIILFDLLKDKKLIKVKGGRTGQFSPLNRYGIDYENNVLFKNEPKRVKSAIKKDAEKYTLLLEEAEKLTNYY